MKKILSLNSWKKINFYLDFTYVTYKLHPIIDSLYIITLIWRICSKCITRHNELFSITPKGILFRVVPSCPFFRGTRRGPLFRTSRSIRSGPLFRTSSSVGVARLGINGFLDTCFPDFSGCTLRLMRVGGQVT